MFHINYLVVPAQYHMISVSRYVSLSLSDLLYAILPLLFGFLMHYDYECVLISVSAFALRSIRLCRWALMCNSNDKRMCTTRVGIIYGLCISYLLEDEDDCPTSEVCNN